MKRDLEKSEKDHKGKGALGRVEIAHEKKREESREKDKKREAQVLARFGKK